MNTDTYTYREGSLRHRRRVGYGSLPRLLVQQLLIIAVALTVVS
jgi:hypothetical protein